MDSLKLVPNRMDGIRLEVIGAHGGTSLSDWRSKYSRKTRVLLLRHWRDASGTQFTIQSSTDHRCFMVPKGGRKVS